LVEPILDTSVMVDLFRRRPEADAYVGTRLRSGRLALHAVVAAELLAGIRDRAEQRQFDEILRRAKMLIPTQADWSLAFRLCRTHSRVSGTDWADCLVAASAIRLNAPVATINEKHFKPIKGLRVIRPY
jgi:predicted nucleic acid-binding protein